MTFHLDLPWPRPPLNLNQRLHWRRRSELNREIRDAVIVLAKQAKIPACRHVEVTLHYATGRRGRVDQDNWVATLKPCADGLVLARVVADDTEHFMRKNMPVIHYPPVPGPRCWLTVEAVR